MCFDICTINIRVGIRVRGLHLVLIFVALVINQLLFAELSLQGVCSCRNACLSTFPLIIFCISHPTLKTAPRRSLCG